MLGDLEPFKDWAPPAKQAMDECQEMVDSLIATDDNAILTEQLAAISGQTGRIGKLLADAEKYLTDYTQIASEGVPLDLTAPQKTMYIDSKVSNFVWIRDRFQTLSRVLKGNNITIQRIFKNQDGTRHLNG